MKEFMTFKSGRFYFCDQFDSSAVKGLLVRATVLNETVVDLPILPELAATLEPEIMYSSISGTAAIEGNPITRKDVQKIAEGEDIPTYSKKDKQEIRNLVEAYHLLSKYRPQDAPVYLTEALLLQLHEVITKDVADENNVPGRYRSGVVKVGDKAHGGIYTPPKILPDIESLMREFIDWINSSAIISTGPFIRAALAHYHLGLIHPFWDGNGRTARLVEAIMLQSSNIKYVPRKLSNYYYQHVDDYYVAFSKSIQLKKDVTPFIEFVLRATVDGLNEIKEDIIYYIRVLSLRNFCTYLKQQKDLTQRQFKLLSFLLDKPVEFSLKDLPATSPFNVLYNRVTTQTARRDLKKLTAMKLLTCDERNRYRLNFRALG